MQKEKTEVVLRFINWAIGATLALCLYIANDAIEKLERLDDRVDSHETRIAVLEVKS